MPSTLATFYEVINEWFAILAQHPSGKTLLEALRPGELSLSELHAPHHVIVGGGFFAHSTVIIYKD